MQLRQALAGTSDRQCLASPYERACQPIAARWNEQLTAGCRQRRERCVEGGRVVRAGRDRAEIQHVDRIQRPLTHRPDRGARIDLHRAKCHRPSRRRGNLPLAIECHVAAARHLGCQAGQVRLGGAESLLQRGELRRHGWVRRRRNISTATDGNIRPSRKQSTQHGQGQPHRITGGIDNRLVGRVQRRFFAVKGVVATIRNQRPGADVQPHTHLHRFRAAGPQRYTS